MTRAITVRLDDEDHAARAKQADQLGVSPGTLARTLVHIGLSEGDEPSRKAARAAVASLVSRSRKSRERHAVTLVHESRIDLGRRR